MHAHMCAAATDFVRGSGKVTCVSTRLGHISLQAWRQHNTQRHMHEHKSHQLVDQCRATSTRQGKASRYLRWCVTFFSRTKLHTTTMNELQNPQMHGHGTLVFNYATPGSSLEVVHFSRLLQMARRSRLCIPHVYNESAASRDRSRMHAGCRCHGRLGHRQQAVQESTQSHPVRGAHGAATRPVPHPVLVQPRSGTALLLFQRLKLRQHLSLELCT